MCVCHTEEGGLRLATLRHHVPDVYNCEIRRCVRDVIVALGYAPQKSAQPSLGFCVLTFFAVAPYMSRTSLSNSNYLVKWIYLL